MEKSLSALEAEKTALEERSHLLMAKIQDLYLGLGHTLNALEYQYEKQHELECNGNNASCQFAWDSSVWSTKQKISRYEEDKQSMISRIMEYSSELNSCKERLKNIEDDG